MNTFPYYYIVTTMLVSCITYFSVKAHENLPEGLHCTLMAPHMQQQEVKVCGTTHQIYGIQNIWENPNYAKQVPEIAFYFQHNPPKEGIVYVCSLVSKHENQRPIKICCHESWLALIPGTFCKVIHGPKEFFGATAVIHHRVISKEIPMPSNHIKAIDMKYFDHNNNLIGEFYECIFMIGDKVYSANLHESWLEVLPAVDQPVLSIIRSENHPRASL